MEDISNANELLKEVLLRKSDELTGSCRNYLESLKTYLKAKKKKDFTVLEIRKALRLAKTSQWRYHKQLVDSYLIQIVKQKGKQTNRYKLTNEKQYKELEAQIQTILDDCLNDIKCSIVPKRSKSKVERLSKTKTAS